MQLLPSSITVSTAPASVEMTTLATARDELGIAGTGSDARIQRYIREASARIVGYCGRDFASAVLVETFRPDPCGRLGQDLDCLLLSRTPVASIASVAEDGAAVDASGYELAADTGELWRIGSSGERTAWSGTVATVTYRGGYAMVTDLPEELEAACLELVRLAWFQRQRDPSLRSESVPGVRDAAYQIGTPGGADGLPDTVRAVLDRYRRLTVA